MKINQELEIYEHLKDCDYNRIKHFKEYKKLMTWNRRLFNIQLVINIFLTITYTIFYSNSNIIPNIKNFIFILSLILLAVSIIQEKNNFYEKAHRNWLAAQAYQELYRDCQFYNQFPGKLEGKDNSYGIYRIRKHLNNLNLLSPHSDILLTENEMRNFEEKYSKSSLTSIKEKLKIELIKKYGADELDIFFYGRDKKEEIDIAFILEENLFNENGKFDDNLKEIQILYLEKYNTYLDINIFEGKEFYSNLQLPFYKNILKGEKILNNLVKKEINEKNIREEIKKKINCNLKLIEIGMKENINELVVTGIYYCYYHLFILILFENNIFWNSEIEMVTGYLSLIKKNNKFSIKEIKEYCHIKQYKNLLLYNYYDFSKIDFNENYNYLKNFIEFYL